ncbi:MAG: hypothetical protein ACT4NP_20765 [Pseudonocardiales bacterium]
MAPTALEERTVQLLATVLTLLRQHPVNKRGQCRLCGWTRWKWRFWRRRRRCTVYAALDHVMGQSLDVVWWKVFGGLEQEVSLADVRRWHGDRREKDRSTRAVNSTLPTFQVRSDVGPAEFTVPTLGHRQPTDQLRGGPG